MKSTLFAGLAILFLAARPVRADLASPSTNYWAVEDAQAREQLPLYK